MRNKYVRSASRARIILSRERDIEKKLDEKERITLELEEYMKQYAALTGENRVLSDATKKRGKAFKALLINKLSNLSSNISLAELHLDFSRYTI